VIAYIYAREMRADADTANVFTMDEGRRVASNITKLPTLLREEVSMKKTVHLSERGDDKNDGLTDETPVLTAAKAVKISIKTGAQEFRVLGSGPMMDRLNAELEEERKKAKRP